MSDHHDHHDPDAMAFQLMVHIDLAGGELALSDSELMDLLNVSHVEAQAAVATAIARKQLTVHIPPTSIPNRTSDARLARKLKRKGLTK